MYFELKVLELPGGKDNPSVPKTKIQLTSGAPFSIDLSPEIRKSEFNPKKVRELLHFVADELIPRLVVKTNEEKFEKELAKINSYRGKKDWHTFYANASQQELDDCKALQKDLYEKAMKLSDDLKKPVITQFNFEQLSPPLMAQSIQSDVNNNVPPPKRP